MFKNIRVSELKPGMFVVDPGIDWTTRPYLYIANKMIESDEDIQKIIKLGYAEVYIDLAKSKIQAFTSDLDVEVESGLSTAFPLPKPKVTLEEELPKAIQVHDTSVAYARQFMNDIRTGKADLKAADGIVEKIMLSLENNADALLSLSRLHHTDSYTHMHCVNVSILATFFSRYTGQDASTIFSAGLAGIFHDLGKSLVPVEILNAPRRLTEEEFAVMRKHPEMGYDQLAQIPEISEDVLLGALQHHEKYDGSGYPFGLATQSISRIGKILAVVDVYDALTSARPYKDGMFPHKALGIMYQHMRGKDLHPDFLALFIRMLGIYPVGGVVILDDGCRGIVKASNMERPSKPVVRVLMDPNGRRLPPRDLDMARPGAVGIASCIPAEGSGLDPSRELGIAL